VIARIAAGRGGRLLERSRPAWCAGGAGGIRRRVTSVMIPSVPSLPTNSLVRESPATSFNPGATEPDHPAVGQHDLHAEHVIGGDAVLHATQGRRRWSRRCHRSSRSRTTTGPAGTRAQLRRPAFFTSALNRPGWVTAIRVTGVDGDVPHPFRSRTTMPRARPPAPAGTGRCRRPRGTTGIRCCVAQRMAIWTCSVDFGPHRGQGRRGRRIERPVPAVLLQAVQVGQHDPGPAGMRSVRPALRPTSSSPTVTDASTDAAT